MSKAFVFDLDGVLIRGGSALPGARRSLELLNKNKIPWILLTNGGGMSEADRVANLTQKLDIAISPNQFLQSHTPFRDFVGTTDRVLVVGGEEDRCRKVAESYGFRDVVVPADLAASWPTVFPYATLTSTMVGARPLVNPEKRFDAIFVFHDSRDATADTQIVLDLLLSRDGVAKTRHPRVTDLKKPAMPIYFSNADMEWATDFPVPRFGQGAFISMVTGLYQGLTGHALEHTVIGKPTRLTYEYASKLLARWNHELRGDASTPNQIYMIGDNQNSDIKGANDFGWESVLVRSGVYKDGDRLFTRPTLITDDVFSAVTQALES